MTALVEKNRGTLLVYLDIFDDDQTVMVGGEGLCTVGTLKKLLNPLVVTPKPSDLERSGE